MLWLRNDERIELSKDFAFGFTQFCIIVNDEKCYTDLIDGWPKTTHTFRKVNTERYVYNRLILDYSHHCIPYEWIENELYTVIYRDDIFLYNKLRLITQFLETRMLYVKINYLNQYIITDVIKYIGLLFIDYHHFNIKVI